MAITKRIKKKESQISRLKHYRSKRNLVQSPEPRGGKQKPSKKDPIFVIQKHDASHLHYDFRLEIGGVLVSWAVPKGPSLTPAIKRLAILTEDHPLEYATFEGVIPQGSYGGGTVMVWDIGTFDNIKTNNNGKPRSLNTCFKEGRIEVFLHGKKLRGGFALIKTSRGWLLIKMSDEYASSRKNPVNTQKKSVLTGRTMRQIAAAGE